jgi:hypothetical protein
VNWVYFPRPSISRFGDEAGLCGSVARCGLFRHRPIQTVANALWFVLTRSINVQREEDQQPALIAARGGECREAAGVTAHQQQVWNQSDAIAQSVRPRR